MRQSRALLFVGAFASTNVVVAASLPRGVGPEFAKYFEAEDKFACISNSKIILKASQVNDGSCDCPDGSDEPGTSACSFIDPLSPIQPLVGSPSGNTNTSLALPGFWCPNAGHIGMYVPFQYVNDGICDYDLCCDGSDEHAHKGGVKCENRCAAIGKEYRRVEDQRKQGQERAAKRRRTLVKESKELRRQVEARVEKLKGEVAELETKRNQLEKALADTERAEKGKVIKSGKGKPTGKLGVLLSVTKKRVGELRDTLDKVLDHRDDLQDKVEELENILSQLKTQYNPNFNDEGVKAAVHAWEDYAAKTADEKKSDLRDADVYAVLKEDNEENGVNWKEFETDDATDTDVLYSFEAYLPSGIRAIIHEKLASLRVWLVENGILADNSGGSESAAVAAARSAFQAADNDLTSRRNSLVDSENDLTKDYGKNDVFRALVDKCVSMETGEYEYELCWMGQSSQKSKKGHGNTNLGSFERIDIETADDEERQDGKSLGKGPRMVLRYENGLHCWNGPNRRSDIWLGCAEKEEVWRVTEAEKCVYKMEVGTPIACEDVGTAVGGKDEL